VDLSHGEAPPNLISINKDDSLKVVLEENPSTGFAWMVNQRKIPQSKKVLQIANQTYIDPPEVDG
jgi:predicted secreted protein